MMMAHRHAEHLQVIDSLIDIITIWDIIWNENLSAFHG